MFMITVLTVRACHCHWHRSIPPRLRLRASQASHSGLTPQTGAGAVRVLSSRGHKEPSEMSLSKRKYEKHNCAFSEPIKSVCQMADNLFTGECHSKSELGPCLAGPPGLFIELYDNSAARPGPPGLDPANTLTEGQTTVLDFFWNWNNYSIHKDSFPRFGKSCSF